MHEKVKERRSYQKKKDQFRLKPLGMKFGVRERWLGRGRDVFCQERLGRNEENIAQTLFIGIPVSRWIDRYQDLSRIKTREIAIEELLRICREVSIAKGARWIEKVSSIYQLFGWNWASIKILFLGHLSNCRLGENLVFNASTFRDVQHLC